MSKHLVVVESPSKCRAINKYLGSDFEVLASYGHVRDLIAKDRAVDPDNDFEMKYEPISRNAKYVNAIAKKLKAADTLYLATDPDREGEAISWHLCEILKEKKLLKDKPVRRIVFYEITKRAVRDALEHPRDLSQDLVEAQKARRALDHLVGFSLSPLLWRKITSNLSAGRVQSPALRLITEREEEIENFEAQEYWTLDAELTTDKDEAFTARLVSVDDKKLEQFDINNGERAEEVRTALTEASKNGVSIAEVTNKRKKRNPYAPFITSTMQQEAARKLGFPTSKTMRVAQQLYEGIDSLKTDDDVSGLITYLRTDSVTLGQDSVREIRDYIGREFGEDRIPEKPPVYRSKVKNAQEAHEAIRPTDVSRTPESMKTVLDKDQWRLYDLIWKRTVASQMIHALIDTVTVDIRCGNFGLRATGSTVYDPGFTVIYKDDKNTKEVILPRLEKGETVTAQKINADQHFTSPPPRYTEASLVKTLEQYGIGRPSTYASIISTLRTREYVEIESKQFRPTPTGKLVSNFLVKNFPDCVDYEFTASLEDDLDSVSRGERNWQPLIQSFWTPFKKHIDHLDKTLTRAEVMQARELGTDPKTGKPVSARFGRYGPFVQLGTKDDEEKPRFASLRKDKGQTVENITLEDALSLLQLPRELGTTEDGEPVRANIGRYGPYVQYGSAYASIKDDDPYTITLERALEVIAEKKRADAEKLIQHFEEEGIRILHGRYGPFITDDNKNVSVPKDRDPASLTLDECRELLASERARFIKKRKTAKKKTSAKTSTGTKKTVKKKAAKKTVKAFKKAVKKKSVKKAARKKTADVA